MIDVARRVPALLPLLVLISPLLAAPAPEGEAHDQAAAAASVNGVVISVAEVERAATQAAHGQTIADDRRPLLLAAALQRLIDRQLIQEYLNEKRLGAKPAEIDLELSRIANGLKQQGITLAEHRRLLRLSEPEFRAEVAWRISWRRYLERQATDENLARYFEKHRAHFDGGARRVAHILLAIDPADPKSVAAATTAAEAIRRQIVDDSVTFADAARKHSIAPTAAAGGEIGVISRHEPMPEEFSRAAFDLPEGGVSPPVVSKFGVHLIRCLEVTPGKLAWQDVRADLRQAVNHYLYDWIAAQQRGKAKIEFTGASPYIDRDSGLLVGP